MRHYTRRYLLGDRYLTAREAAALFLNAAARWRRIGDKGMAIRDCLKRAREWRTKES